MPGFESIFLDVTISILGLHLNNVVPTTGWRSGIAVSGSDSTLLE